MLKRTEPVKIRDEILLGRPKGKELRERVVDRIDSLSADSVLPIDFSGTKFMDFSCADELVVKLIKRVTGGDLAGRHVILTGLQVSVRENIQAALELRQLVCVCETAMGSYELLGKVNQEIQETYDLARKKGRLTARDIVEQTGKTISASSNRLTRLKELGILVCVINEAVDTGGRQNVYEPLG